MPEPSLSSFCTGEMNCVESTNIEIKNTLFCQFQDFW